jgi:hypothetical protein
MRNALGALGARCARAAFAAAVRWTRARAFAGAVGGTCWLGACAADPHTTTATLELQTLPSCELSRTAPLALRASGDFPSVAQPFEAKHAFSFDDFPPDTRFLAVEAGTGVQRAGGMLPLSGGDMQRALWMLPFGRSCPLGDPFAVVTEGTALAPLPDGGLLFAGGRDDRGEGSASARVLAPGAALVTEVPDGMLLRRVGASATPVAEGVLVVGGSPDNAFELYSSRLGRFDRARSNNLVSGPRRDHGALALSDDRVLVAGGVSELGAEALSSAEIIDVASGRAHATDGELISARVRPSLLALDSGMLLVALGNERSEPGSALVRDLERFDAKHERFEPISVRLPEHASAAVVALPGDRVAFVGCDAADVPCEIALLLPSGDGDSEFVQVAPEFLSRDWFEDSAGLRGLTQLRLLALHDGRVLVTGHGPSAPARRGFIIDFDEPTIESYAQLSRVPDALLELADGSRIEADASGLSLAREDTQSAFDDAAPIVAAGNTTLAFDTAERWRLDGDGLLALEPARADLPRLRFADVRIEIALSGKGAVLLAPDGAPPIEVMLGESQLALGDCALAHARGDAIAIERHRDQVVLHSGKHAQQCSAAGLGERIGLALHADRHTRVTRLLVERL